MQNQLTQPSSYLARFWSMRWRRYIWTSMFLLLCTLLAVLFVQGFEHGSINNFRDQSVQLPVISSYADSTLYSGDFLLDARQSYVTWFYPLLGQASRIIPLNDLMFVLYVISILLTVGSVYAMAEALFPQRSVGIFAVILWMAYFPNPGGDFTHSPFVTHSTFAISLDLWALVMIFRRKFRYAALILGLTANINAMTSFFVGITWLCAVLQPRENRLSNLFKGGLIMAVSALPVFYWRFSQPVAESSQAEFTEIIRTRLWYAVFPFSINIGLWVGFAVLLALWVYSFRFGKSTNHQPILAMTAGIAALCIVGTILTEIIPVEFVIELQPIRSTWLINLFILLYLAHMIRQMLFSPRRKLNIYAFLLIGIFVAARWILELFPPRQPTPYTLYADLDISWMQNYPLLAACVFLIVMVALYRVVPRLTQTAYSHRAILWIGFAMFGFVVPGFVPSNIPDEQREMTSSWVDTLHWIKNNTPRDAQFITPPTMDGFRIEAERSQIGDWKDGTVGIFTNGWAIEWYDRMLSLGFDPQTFAFQPMTQERLCLAAMYYQANYVVVFRRDGIQGRSVYQNEWFQVIPVENLSCSVFSRGTYDPKQTLLPTY